MHGECMFCAGAHLSANCAVLEAAKMRKALNKIKRVIEDNYDVAKLETDECAVEIHKIVVKALKLHKTKVLK